MIPIHRSRGAASFFFRRFAYMLCASLVLASLFFTAPAARAQAGEPGFDWTLEVDVPAPDGGGEISAQAVEAARAALQTGLAGRLSDPGVQVQVRAEAGVDTGEPVYTAAFSGSGGVEQLRGMVFTDLREQVRLPGDGMRLELRGRAARGQTVTLLLDSNISTGYRWDFAGLDPSQFTLAGQPVEVTPPAPHKLGAPQTLAVTLQAAADGDLTAGLAYRRGWEAAGPQVRLSIQAEGLPARLDLSDPQRDTSDPLVLAEAGPLQSGSIDAQALPASFDWRTQGKVSAVRNQGGCGSCWAFGVVGVLESAVKVQLGGPETDLSEQYLVNCNTYGDGCGGGWWTAHDFHTNTLGKNQSAAGSVTETQLKYTATDGSCTVDYSKGYKLTEWHYINYDTPDIAAIKQAILNYGPVGTAVCVGDKFYDYTGGVFSTSETCAGDVNHAVILVGWDDSTQSWIMKNSWGASWAESGYMRIKYGTSKIGFWANYVVLSPVPQLNQPAAGAVTASLTPQYSWAALSGALEYQLQVSAAADFATTLVDQTSTGLSLAPTTPLSPNTQYTWRVRARTGNGWGAWSTARTLKTLPSVPVPVGPAGSGTAGSLRPTLTWSMTGTASKYEVQVSTLADFSTLKTSGSTLTAGLSWTPAADLPRNASLFWRVRAVGAYGASAWSAGAAFTTLDPPQPPVLASPASGAVIAPAAHPTLRWTPPAVSTPAGYHLQISTASNFSTIFVETDVAGTSYPFPGTFAANTLYYWRVASYNGSPAVYSAYTAARSLKILPTAPALTAPVSITTTSLRPEMSWAAIPNTPTYDIQISKYSTCASPFKTAAVTQAAYTPTSDLPKLASLYWRVRTRGKYGTSGWSPCQKFWTPNPPSIPALSSPASGSTLPSTAPFRPTLKWKAALNSPDGYIVQVSLGNSFAPAVTVEQVINDPLQVSLVWPADLNYGVYYWRVRSFRSGPVYSSWSTPRYFKTQAGVQGLVTEPYLGQPIAGLTVTVSGTSLSAVTGADGRYLLPLVPSGARTLVFSKADHVVISKAMTVSAGGLRTLDAAVKKLAVKVVLEWTNPSAELDANLWLPAANPYHIHWDQLGSQTAFPYAQLTSETSNGRGPEPIVIARRYAGKYVYAVYRWNYNTFTASLPESGAVVKVYRGTALVKTYPVPAGTGKYWHVFDLDAASGTITDRNVLTDTSPGPYDPDATEGVQRKR